MKKCCCIAFMLAVGLWATVSSAEDIQWKSLICETTNQLLPGVFNVITYAAPRSLALSKLGLKEAGLQAGDQFIQSDEIRIFADKSKMGESPKARIWINAGEGNRYWFQTGGSGSAEDYSIEPGECVVIYTRTSQKPIVWKNIFKTNSD